MGSAVDHQIYKNVEDNGLYIMLDDSNECGLTGKKIIRYASLKNPKTVLAVPYDHFHGMTELANGKKVRRFKKHDFSERLKEINAKSKSEIAKQHVVQP